MTKRLLLLFAIGTALIVVAHLLDRWVLEHVSMPRINESDLGRMLRVMGFLPLWGIAGIALALCDWPIHKDRGRWPALRRGVLLVAVPALGGIVAEVMKIVVRRLRPNVGVDGSAFDGYAFRAWSEETFSTGGLGMPSSHALVAFAAAAILSKLFPRATVVWWLLAIGCGFTRIASGAHFLSDVVVAGVLGYVVGMVVWREEFRGSY